MNSTETPPAQETRTPAIGESLTVSEYASLRSEIEKRIDMRQQVLLAMPSSDSAFFTIGLQPGISGLTVLVYPLIALFIAAGWTHNDLRIGQITLYIRTRVEPCLGEQGGWETYRRTTFQAGNKKQGTEAHPLAATAGKLSLSTRGLFLTTQVLAIAIGSVRSFPMLFSPATLPLVVLLVGAATGATVLTYTTLQHRRS